MDASPLVPGWFSYLAWTLVTPRIGPFVLPGRRRSAATGSLLGVAGQVEQLPGAGRARVLAATFVPPLPGGPRYDLAILARGERPLVEEVAERARRAGLPEPALAASARNVVRFGDTERGDGTILLNHFAGDLTAADAVAAWSAASPWYGDVLGVDNSTLLEFEQPAPYLVMNYARIPGAVPPFLLQQRLRPSFHRRVRRVLDAAGAHPYPIFVKAVTR